MRVQMRCDLPLCRRAVLIAPFLTVVGVAPYRAVAQLPFGGTIGDGINRVIREGQKEGAKVLQSGGKAAGAAVNAAISPSVQIVNIIAGKETLGDAGKKITAAQGGQLTAIGQGVSDFNAASSNIKVVAAEAIGGDVGKTIMVLGTDPERLQVEFASTATIAAGKVVSGKLRPEELLAAPLAAAIRAAEKEFESSSKPLPPEIKSMFSSQYPAEVLNEARWAVGSISISVPDLVNQFQKLEGVDNAVTVGHVTVFVRDPERSYHWWAHELQHQVQYKAWGIDSFAYKYATSCHDVESEAEAKAQQVSPVLGRVSLVC